MPKHLEDLSENDLWLLSFYRTSEIAGALFFGRVARSVRPGPLQVDITHHFADEANHARWWTECIADLGTAPLNLGGLYNRHLKLPGVHPRIGETLARIMTDERWHIQYVRAALRDQERVHGPDEVRAALKRFDAADEAVFTKLLAEYGERFPYVTAEPAAVR